MPRRLRAALMLVSAMLIVSGAAAIVIAVVAHDTRLGRLRSIAGGLVAMLLGAGVIRALRTGRGPKWLVDFVERIEELD